MCRRIPRPRRIGLRFGIIVLQKDISPIKLSVEYGVWLAVWFSLRVRYQSSTAEVRYRSAGILYLYGVERFASSSLNQQRGLDTGTPFVEAYLFDLECSATLSVNSRSQDSAEEFRERENCRDVQAPKK